MNLPNKLTMARVIAVPFFIISYIKSWFIAATIIFILASITDMLDGKIARKRNLITNFGKIMDPLADKILVYSAFCLLVEGGEFVPAWAFTIILAREFLVAGVRAVAASKGIVVAADMAGKIKTVLQMIAVPSLILCQGIYYYKISIPLSIFGQVMFYAALVMTIVSGINYTVKNIEVFRD